MQLRGCKAIHIGALYRPNESDEHTLHELETSLSRIGDHGEQIILGGDFNFPGWNWKEYALKTNCGFQIYNTNAEIVLKTNASRKLF